MIEPFLETVIGGKKVKYYETTRNRFGRRFAIKVGNKPIERDSPIGQQLQSIARNMEDRNDKLALIMSRIRI